MKDYCQRNIKLRHGFSLILYHIRLFTVQNLYRSMKVVIRVDLIDNAIYIYEFLYMRKEQKLLLRSKFHLLNNKIMVKDKIIIAVYFIEKFKIHSCLRRPSDLQYFRNSMNCLLVLQSNYTCLQLKYFQAI